MPSQNFEQELEDTVKTLKENPQPASGETRTAPKFTAIEGTGRPQTQVASPLDSEHLVAVVQQRYEYAAKVLNDLELEHRVERAKLLQTVINEIELLKQKGQRDLAALDKDYARRKRPAKEMMELVSPLAFPPSV